MRYTIKPLRWWHVWDNVAKTVVSSQVTQEAAELVAYELNKGVEIKGVRNDRENNHPAS